MDHNYSQFPTETIPGSSGSGATSTSRPPNHISNSNIWQCFDKEEIPNPDGRVTTKYRRKFCKLLFTSCISKSGTDNLKRHMSKCMTGHGQVNTITITRTKLQRNRDGLITTTRMQYARDLENRDCTLFPLLSFYPTGFFLERFLMRQLGNHVIMIIRNK